MSNTVITAKLLSLHRLETFCKNSNTVQLSVERIDGKVLYVVLERSKDNLTYAVKLPVVEIEYTTMVVFKDTIEVSASVSDLAKIAEDWIALEKLILNY